MKKKNEKKSACVYSRGTFSELLLEDSNEKKKEKKTNLAKCVQATARRTQRMYALIRMYTHLRVHTHVYAFTRTYVCKKRKTKGTKNNLPNVFRPQRQAHSAYAQGATHIYLSLSVYLHIYIYIHIYIYTHTYTYIYTYMHILPEGFETTEKYRYER